MTDPRIQSMKTMASQEEQPQSLEDKVIDVLRACRGSRKLVILIVAVALLLDNMLLTSVVPIIPAYLYELHHKEKVLAWNESMRTSTMSPAQEVKESSYLAEYPLLLTNLNDKGNLVIPVPSQETSKGGPGTDPGGKNCPCPFPCQEGDKSIGDGDENSKNPKPSLPLRSIVPNREQDDDDDDDDVGPPESEEKLPPLTTTTTEGPNSENIRHQELKEENFEVGVMFASKPIVQALTNPFVGVTTSKIGYSIPMFVGFIIMFLSTLRETFSTLLVARMLQGVGSACTSVAGMGMLAEKYPDDRERGNAMAIALGGLALGVLIGPPFGGVLYEFVGKSTPFIILAFLALLDGMLQLVVLQPKVSKGEVEGASLMTLIKDPYILVAAGALTFANAGIAVLEPSLPLWMMDTMHATNWEQGAVFLPASISYLIGTNIFGPLGHRMGRWLASMTALIIIGVSLMFIPFAKRLDDLIIPNAAIGFAIGMVDSSMMPMLGYLVDIRHTSVYGSVYAIGDVAFCAGFVIGPLLSGSIGRYLGFEGLVICTAMICFLFAPFLLLLRNPPILNEEQVLLQAASGSVRYTNYTDDESPSAENRCINKALQNPTANPAGAVPGAGPGVTLPFPQPVYPPTQFLNGPVVH